MQVIYDGIDTQPGAQRPGRLKVFDGHSALMFSCEAHNDSVASNAWRPDAGCPPGDYTLGVPESCDPGAEQREMGLWFTPLYGIPDHEGIGIHGGGSSSANPLAPRQGWYPTENCIRLQNEDNERFVRLIEAQCPIRVVQRAR